MTHRLFTEHVQAGIEKAAASGFGIAKTWGGLSHADRLETIPLLPEPRGLEPGLPGPCDSCGGGGSQRLAALECP